MSNFDLNFYGERINALLEQGLSTGAPPLTEALRYATLLGGKRFRPLLVYATGLSLGAALGELDRPAMSVELIHAYSLVHDDLPAMDNDLLRRGQPTCHVVYGEATAILAGDAMQALAFEVLAEPQQIHALEMIRVLACACGATGMAGGQSQDLLATGRSITEAQLQNIHRAKTGALIKASVLMGALASPQPLHAEYYVQLNAFGLLLGLAYQVQDDIFDVELSTEERGKQQGADAALNKPTYPAILGIEEAKKKLKALNVEIEQELIQLQLHNTPLAALVKEVLCRRY